MKTKLITIIVFFISAVGLSSNITQIAESCSVLFPKNIIILNDPKNIEINNPAFHRHKNIFFNEYRGCKDYFEFKAISVSCGRTCTDAIFNIKDFIIINTCPVRLNNTPRDNIVCGSFTSINKVDVVLYEIIRYSINLKTFNCDVSSHFSFSIPVS